MSDSAAKELLLVDIQGSEGFFHGPRHNPCPGQRNALSPHELPAGNANHVMAVNENAMGVDYVPIAELNGPDVQSALNELSAELDRLNRKKAPAAPVDKAGVFGLALSALAALGGRKAAKHSVSRRRLFFLPK